MADVKRLALLITGQFRAIEGVTESSKKLAGIDHTMFVSTWRRKGLKSGGWISTKQVQVLLGAAVGNAFPADLYGDCAGLLRLLPAFDRSLGRSIQTLDEVEPGFVSTIGAEDFDIEDDELYDGANADEAFNEERLLYKTLRGIRLMERWEKVHDQRFTHIMRLRPDALLLDDDLSGKLDERVFFDWRGLGSDGETVERVGDNVVLGPRDVVISLVKRSLRGVRLRMLVENHRTDIHQILAAEAAVLSLGTGEVKMRFCAGEWPTEDFIDALAERAAESSDQTMLVGFYHHIRADQALERGEHQLALDRLSEVPSDRQGKMNHLRIAALAHHALGDHETAVDYAKRFRIAWDGSHPSIQENMFSLLADLKSIVPV